MTSLDPAELAARQLAIDSALHSDFAELAPRKRSRMLASPLSFLRGSARLFYEMLAARGELTTGPSGTGHLVGDAHLENFGAFAPARHGDHDKRRAVFDLNDFDETLVGPFHWDVVRLTTSLILAGRELGVPGPRVLELSRLLLDAHSDAAFRGATPCAAPRPVAQLIAQVEARPRQSLLDARTQKSEKTRHFALGERYLELPAPYRRALGPALDLYLTSLADDDRPRPEQMTLLDAAFRVAGTGSLGALRIAALVEGKGGADGSFLFDLKERLPSSAELAGAGPGPRSAGELVSACRACLGEPPRQLGFSQITALGVTRDLIVRRLTPQEDKLDFTALVETDLDGLARHLGALLGRAHARGASAPGDLSAWSRSDRDGLLERAVALSGLHEAVYLAYCLRTGHP